MKIGANVGIIFVNRECQTNVCDQVEGKTYSMIGEAIYENRLKPFTFSAGFHMNWKYMDNHYLGDAASENGIHSSGAYGFAQIKGSLFQKDGEAARLNYVAGFQLSSAFQLRYDFELSQYISEIAMVSDTRIRKNSMEWTVGNPSLKPDGRYEHALTVRKQACGRNSSVGNFVMLGVAWNINRGKEYRKIEKNISNRERETGILK